MPPRLIIPCDDLRARYEAGQTSLVIARHYHCSPTTIIKHLRRCGLAIRPSPFQAKAVPEALLRRLYQAEGWPIRQIAAHFGVSVSTISNARRRYRIPARPRRRSPRADSGLE